MDTVVVATRVLLGRRVEGPVAIRVRDGRIVEVTRTPERSAGNGLEGSVLESGVLTPGLVDIQVNGAFGVDFAEAGPADLARVARELPRTGVTSFLPTLITAELPTMLGQAGRLAAAMTEVDTGARPLGLHLEGPFLSTKRPGVHDPAPMVAPSAARLDELLGNDAVRRTLRMVTLAPELPGALDAVRRLVDAGVLVSVGHTDATGAQTTAAADAGARMITHLFNAQRGLGHREPGVPGVALVDDRFTLGLIADLAHVGADACRLVFKAAGDRVALVTDAVAAAGMPPGGYRLGGADVLLGADGVPRSATGTIAGSALTLDRAVRNIVSLGVDPAAALAAASIVPADVIGEPDLGRIAPGAAADLVWWDDQLRPRKVWARGEVVYDAEESESDDRLGSGAGAAPLGFRLQHRRARC